MMRLLPVCALAVGLLGCGGAPAQAARSSASPPSAGAEQPVAAEESGVELAMVALSEARLPTAEAFRAALTTMGQPALAVSDLRVDDGVMTFNLTGGGMGAIALMPAPIPWRDIGPLVANTPLFEDAEQRMRAHRAHLLVTLMGQEGTAKERKLRLTQAVAAAATDDAAVGVYWGDAPAIKDAAFFVARTREASADSLPVSLWLGFSFAGAGKDRVSILTRGMHEFGRLDLMVQGPAENDTLFFLLDLAKYVVTSGADIPDGDTVGHTETQRIPVRHVPSPVSEADTVVLIDL